MTAQALKLGMTFAEFYYMPLGMLSDLIDANLILNHGFEERIELNEIPIYLE